MIPYNPSSFNSNKTILEQILEIKKWLIAHPSYKVYYCTSNFMPTGDDDRAFSEIAGTEEEVQNIAVGDLLVFPDAYYSEVIAVDLDNEMVTIALPATNFSGPQGATGPSGADGTNGTCIRYCNTNKNSNPSTTYAVSDITFSTGLQINDCILFKNNRIGFVDYISGGTFRVTQNIIIDGKDGKYVSNARIDENGDLIITLYDPESMIQSSIDVGHVVGSDGNDGVSVTNVTIDGNSHLIVTLSDGSSIDAGSVSSGGGANVVTLSTTSGTLTPEELAILQEDDSVIIYNGGYYKKHYSDNSSMTFVRIYDAGTLTYERRFDITISSRAYLHTQAYLPASAGNITSYGATSGQVLQADGNGGASWQNAGGGKYLHNVQIRRTPGTYSEPYYMINFSLINDNGTVFGSDTQIQQALQSNGFTTQNNCTLANGFYANNSKVYLVFGMYYYSPSAYSLVCYDESATNHYTTIQIASTWGFTDKVTAL
jgi:hypothetical protein